ncbi:MAG: endonuclease/exonuclease/phosphatase family protein [Conchiformibius sp.]|nr:endonuclease/exonuclease/phosphatase family protein [Conchiformibius sp.]
MPTHPILHYLSTRFRLLACLSLAALLIGQLGNLFWFAELFSHFLPYYAVCFLLAACTARGIFRYLWPVCFLLSLIWLAYPYQLSHTTNSKQKPSWTLLWYNVHLDNPNPLAEIGLIHTQQPDIIALAELNRSTTGWQKLLSAYPYGCEHAEDHSPFSLFVRARSPFKNCEVQTIDDIPYIRAVLNDQTVIYALHPPPPINDELARTRRLYLEQTATRIAAESNVLVVGDLNSSQFSPLFRQFTDAAALQSALSGYTPTWKPFGLNIDHVLYRSRYGHTPRVLPQPWQHSDHRALLAEWY